MPFTWWLWDEMGRKAGNLNKTAPTELALTVPPLNESALDFLLRLLSFWAGDIRHGKGSENLWRKPVVNVFDDEKISPAEKSLSGKDDQSYERYFMPLLGPGRAFIRVEVIKEGESAARYHSHSMLDEYYLILEGSGTLRYNDKDVVLKRGDLVAKPAGPDAVSQLIADRGEALRILDMEVWHGRPYHTKDVVLNPDQAEVIMRGPGWSSIFPVDSLLTIDDFRKHYDEGYKRTKDGAWVPSSLRGHKKVRSKTSP